MMVVFDSRQERDDSTSRLLRFFLGGGNKMALGGLERSPWDTQVQVETAEWCGGSGGREEPRSEVCMWISVCVKCETQKCVSACVHMFSCVRDEDSGSRRRSNWGTRGHRCERRKCTFSFSQGGGMSGEPVGGVGEMQVVLLNVPVSSKPDKSNQVLSGSATISWLFEASGPCSSDLFGRGFLSRHLEVMWREKKGFFGVMVECARDIISVLMTETP